MRWSCLLLVIAIGSILSTQHEKKGNNRNKNPKNIQKRKNDSHNIIKADKIHYIEVNGGILIEPMNNWASSHIFTLPFSLLSCTTLFGNNSPPFFYRHDKSQLYKMARPITFPTIFFTSTFLNVWLHVSCSS